MIPSRCAAERTPKCDIKRGVLAATASVEAVTKPHTSHGHSAAGSGRATAQGPSGDSRTPYAFSGRAPHARKAPTPGRNVAS